MPKGRPKKRCWINKMLSNRECTDFRYGGFSHKNRGARFTNRIIRKKIKRQTMIELEEYKNDNQ